MRVGVSPLSPVILSVDYYLSFALWQDKSCSPLVELNCRSLETPEDPERLRYTSNTTCSDWTQKGKKEKA